MDPPPLEAGAVGLCTAREGGVKGILLKGYRRRISGARCSHGAGSRRARQSMGGGNGRRDLSGTVIVVQLQHSATCSNYMMYSCARGCTRPALLRCCGVFVPWNWCWAARTVVAIAESVSEAGRARCIRYCVQYGTETRGRASWRHTPSPVLHNQKVSIP